MHGFEGAFTVGLVHLGVAVPVYGPTKKQTLLG